MNLILTVANPTGALAKITRVSRLAQSASSFNQGLAALGHGDLGGAALGILGSALPLLQATGPCSIQGTVGTAAKVLGIGGAMVGASRSIDGIQGGDYIGGGLALAQSAADVYSMMRSCFTAEMLLDVEGGKRRADTIQVGDKLWSRSEFEPHGPIELKEVEEVFVRTAPIWNVHVAGQIIRTTGEHPFWVLGRGWIPAQMLEIGDLLSTRGGDLVPVEGVADSGAVETVYNWRVADYHTYFVSAMEIGAPIWAHNVACGTETDVKANGPRYGVRVRGRGVPGRRPGSNGHPDHQEGVAATAAYAESIRGPNERVAVQERIANPDSNRIPDVQIIDTTTNRTTRIFEVERQPNSRYNRNRVAEYQSLGIPNEVLPIPGS